MMKKINEMTHSELQKTAMAFSEGTMEVPESMDAHDCMKLFEARIEMMPDDYIEGEEIIQ